MSSKVQTAVAAAIAFTAGVVAVGMVAFAAPTSSQVGVIDIVAGIPDQLGFTGDGGQATAARIGGVRDVVRGFDGSLYISDLNYRRIRKVAPNGIITTIAGTGVEGFSGDGGPATAARLSQTHNMSLSPDGARLVIADSGNSRVRSINLTTGIITTVAGNGTAGYNGDNRQATTASLNWPAGVSFTSDGSMLISEPSGHRVRRVATNGIITTIAGTGVAGSAGQGGVATSAQVDGPRATAQGPDGSIYIGEQRSNKVRRITPAGLLVPFAGTGVASFSGDGGPALNATLNDVRDLQLDGNRLFVADSKNGSVRSINLSTNVITTVAGSGVLGWRGDDISASTARLQGVRGVEAGDGWLYLVTDNALLLRVGLTAGSSTPTATQTATPTATQSTPTATATATATATPTSTATTTATPTPTPTATTPTMLVSANSPWRYLDNGTDQGTAWRADSYNDSTWKQGPTEIGYGDSDEASLATAGRITYYARKSFDAGPATNVAGLQLRGVIDDGAVAYLNGVEIWRHNMAAGTVTAATRAATAKSAPAESQWVTSQLPAGALRPGSNTLAVEIHNDSSSSSDISFNLELTAVSGSPSPTASTTTTATPTPTPPTGGVKVVAAGDVSCHQDDVNFNNLLGNPTDHECLQKYTADVIASRLPQYERVLALGDLQYERGSLTSFQNAYNRTWGAFKDKTSPVPGNHEYASSPTADGYFEYFNGRGTNGINQTGPAGKPGEGWYSFDTGSGSAGWHIIALNSQCADEDNTQVCSGTPQYNWLAADLAANQKRCVMAYMHHPRFSSGAHGSNSRVQPLWDLLAASGADVVLSGHEHNYERFDPQTPSGAADPNGIRQFIIGTGGKELRPAGTPRPNSAVFQNSTAGVMEFTLGDDSYSWNFLRADAPNNGSFTDTGSATCH